MHKMFNVCRLTLLLLILGCSLMGEAHGYCSLEKMKTFAREACERLFQQDEGREKRSIDYQHHHQHHHHEHHQHINEISTGKSPKNHHIVGRSSFPKGGYLRVSKMHYHRLMNLDVRPRYKPKKQPQEPKSRYRRQAADGSVQNISYCCYNVCGNEFFC